MTGESFRKKLALCVLMSSLLIPTACGPRRPKLEYAAVSGTVKLDGKPLDRGRVVFFHTASGESAVGGIKSDGTYTLQAPTGENSIFVDSQPAAQSDAAAPPTTDRLAESKIPHKYTNFLSSGLKRTVKPGQNAHDIEMTTNQASPQSKVR
jgi:hypothetical protein